MSDAAVSASVHDEAGRAEADRDEVRRDEAGRDEAGRDDVRRAPVLQVRNLVKDYRQSGGTFMRETALRAVDDVSFDVRPGEIVCLLGESGCGKTTLARMIMHLARPTSGSIVLEGREVQGLDERRFRPLRQSIQMVYQNPFDCLDPSRRVSSLLEEPLKLWHKGLSKEERASRVREILGECGLDEGCLVKKPPQFSGGQLQRLSIARALLVGPKLLIADEIVSALDVPIQNQILDLLVRMKEEHGFSVLFITHDLSVARKVSDRVIVMNQGKIIDMGTPHDVLDSPRDPYIKKLASSVFTFEGNPYGS